VQVKEAILVQFTEVARRPLRLFLSGFTQIANERLPTHRDFAIVSDTQTQVSQRSADAARAMMISCVQADDRGALRQAVAFIDRQAQICRTLQQTRRDRRTTDRGKA